MKLQIEMNNNFDFSRYTESLVVIDGIGVMITPPIDDSYWMMRVPVSKKQAIVCFPKFGSIGIGFRVEGEDWNVNMPSSCETQYIYDHIKVNKGQRSITRATCIAAIDMLQVAIAQLMDTDGKRAQA